MKPKKIGQVHISQSLKKAPIFKICKINLNNNYHGIALRVSHAIIWLNKDSIGTFSTLNPYSSKRKQPIPDLNE